MSVQATVAPRAGALSVVSTLLAALALYAVVADAAVTGAKTGSSLRTGAAVSPAHVQVRDKDDKTNNISCQRLQRLSKQALTDLAFSFTPSSPFRRPTPVLIGSCLRRCLRRCLRHCRVVQTPPSPVSELPSTSTRKLL